MQDRANVSADFLDMMRQEIIEVIKKYIDVDEKDIDVRLTNKTNEDGTTGAPALYANIPIAGIREEMKKEKNIEKETKEKKQENVKKEDNTTEKKKNSEEHVEEKASDESNEEVVKDLENKGVHVINSLMMRVKNLMQKTKIINQKMMIQKMIMKS